jgi:Flp pilus assembly pilin Flp
MFRSIRHPKRSLRALGARLPRVRVGQRERGAVTAEFALLLALVAMAIIAAAITLGLAVTHLFDTGTAGIPHA